MASQIKVGSLIWEDVRGYTTNEENGCLVYLVTAIKHHGPRAYAESVLIYRNAWHVARYSEYPRRHGVHGLNLCRPSPKYTNMWVYQDIPF